MYTVAYPSSYSSVTRVTVAGTRVTGRSWPRPLDVKGDWLVSPVGNHESPEDAGQMAMGRKHQVPSRYALRGRGKISSQERKVERQLSKALMRNPLALLDQNCNAWRRRTMMPQGNVADVEEASLLWDCLISRCWMSAACSTRDRS